MLKKFFSKFKRKPKIPEMKKSGYAWQGGHYSTPTKTETVYVQSSNNDMLTGMLLGQMLSGHSTHSPAPTYEETKPAFFSGGGGDYSGAGATSSWSSDSGSSSSSYDSGSSYSSSDSGSSSSGGDW